MRGATGQSPLHRPHLRFQSTLPVRGATKRLPGQLRRRGISIHAPRAGSDTPWRSHGASGKISIHAPRAGSDTLSLTAGDRVKVFQSTLPVRGATRAEAKKLAAQYISIHAPRAGSDEHTRRAKSGLCDFNPRSPCGERRGLYGGDWQRDDYFNPRSPCGERL